MTTNSYNSQIGQRLQEMHYYASQMLTPQHEDVRPAAEAAYQALRNTNAKLGKTSAEVNTSEDELNASYAFVSRQLQQVAYETFRDDKKSGPIRLAAIVEYTALIDRQIERAKPVMAAEPG